MCDCNNDSCGCVKRIPSSQFRDLLYVKGLDENLCSAYMLVSNISGSGVTTTGNLIAGTGVAFSGSGTNRLVGSGDLTISVAPASTGLGLQGTGASGSPFSLDLSSLPTLSGAIPPATKIAVSGGTGALISSSQLASLLASDMLAAIPKGDLLAGAGVSLSASGIGKLLGAGNITITATSGISSVSVNSPMTGLGTPASPLDINFANLSVTDINGIASVIPAGTIADFIGKDSSGDLVSQPIFTPTTNSISGSTQNHPNSYYGTPTAFMATPTGWLVLPDGRKIPTY